MTSNGQQHFVIISSGRAGSTMLKSLLDNHPAIVCFGEVLNRDKILWDQGDFNATMNTPEVHALRNQDPTAFIDMLLHSVEHESVRAVGYKSIYNHYSYGPAFKRLIPYLLDKPGLKVLHNKRRNVFKTFCSYRVAAERTKRGKLMNAYQKGDHETDMHIIVDPARCLEFIRSTEREGQRFDALFADCDMTDVHYEDLARRTGLEMKRLFAFLGVEYAPVRPRTHKVRRQPIEDVVTNYDEVRQALTDEGYGDFFKNRPAPPPAETDHTKTRTHGPA